jgi:hypothetical protein
MTRAHVLLVAGLAFAAGAPPHAAAQACDAKDAVAQLAVERLPLRLAWLYITAAPGTSEADGRDLQFLLQDAARVLRERVSGADSVVGLLPDSVVGARTLLSFSASVRQTSRTAVAGWTTAPDTAPVRLQTLIRDVLDVALPLSPALPDDAAQRAFTIALATSSDANSVPDEATNSLGALPVFLLRQPPYEPAMAPAGQPIVEYPRAEIYRGYEATVSLSFNLDASGHVVPGSIRDMHETAVQRLNRNRRDTYIRFRDAVERAVLRTTYLPARLAGCPVPMQVQQSFSFKIKR